MESLPTCRRCGHRRDRADPAALAWVSEHDREGRIRWICPGCARRHLRAIEARLLERWW